MTKALFFEDRFFFDYQVKRRMVEAKKTNAAASTLSPFYVYKIVNCFYS